MVELKANTSLLLLLPPHRAKKGQQFAYPYPENSDAKDEVDGMLKRGDVDLVPAEKPKK